MNLITDGLIWLSCSRETKNVKCLQTVGSTNRKTNRKTDRRIDDGQQVIWKAYVNFQFRSAKNLLKTSQNKFQTEALIVLWRQKKPIKFSYPLKRPGSPNYWLQPESLLFGNMMILQNTKKVHRLYNCNTALHTVSNFLCHHIYLFI